MAASNDGLVHRVACFDGSRGIGRSGRHVDTQNKISGPIDFDRDLRNRFFSWHPGNRIPGQLAYEQTGAQMSLIRPPRFIPKKGLPKPTPKQRTLAEWRRIDLREKEGAASTTKTIADVMPAVVKNIRLDKKRADLEILKVWNNLIDPNVTKHAQPVNIAKGTLFVKVDNSVNHYHILQYHRKEILDRLQSAFGKDVIQKISFRIG
jgi:hypothetical protein